MALFQGPCLTQNSQGSHQVSAVLGWQRSLLEWLCWFKRQVVWPGNESCLYGAREHKERLSGSGRWPRLGRSSSSSAKHNLSLGRVPTLAHPATSVRHSQEGGGGRVVVSYHEQAHEWESGILHRQQHMGFTGLLHRDEQPCLWITIYCQDKRTRAQSRQDLNFTSTTLRSQHHLSNPNTDSSSFQILDFVSGFSKESN